MEREERSDSAKHLQLLLGSNAALRRHLWKALTPAQVRGEVLAGQGPETSRGFSGARRV